MSPPTYRAILMVAGPDRGEYWQIQRRRIRAVPMLRWRTEYWEAVTSAATQAEATHVVNRLEYDSVIYPTEREAPIWWTAQ